MANQGTSNRIQGAQTGNQHNPSPSRQGQSGGQGGDQTDQMQQVGADVICYLTDYAKENPGYAALWCLGVGFVLGWKLKPW